MNVPSWLRAMLVVDDSVLDEQFHLAPEDKNTREDEPPEAPDEEKHKSIRPIPMAELLEQHREHRKGAESPPQDESTKESGEQEPPQRDRKLHRALDVNRATLESVFHLPDNADIVVREFTIGAGPDWQAMVVFVDGMADKNVVNAHILQPLMLLTHLVEDEDGRSIRVVAEALLPGTQMQKVEQWDKLTAGILTGSTAVIVDGCDTALIVETKGWEHRMVGLAQTEVVVRGPHDAFTESFRANTALVRSRLRSENLITEMLSVGNVGRTDVAVMYLRGIANPNLVDEVKRRVQAVDVDYLADSGVLEQFLEDNPSSLMPQLMSTERPDRIAQMLSEGNVAIFLGHSPFVLSVPVVLWSLVHTAEDAYLRFPFGTFIRLIRWSALLIAVFLPSLYVAMAYYHPEMIPTDLLLAIAGSREQVPFPLLVEVLLMEFSIELIREAGVRIPSVIGPTIGIVGALIIGQAAVQAGLVSPLLVIVIAVTSLSSFAIPNYGLSMATRVLRFLFLLAGSVLGFYGISLVAAAFLAHLTVQRSFGVPYLAPIAPSMDASPDVLLRGHAFAMNQRPTFLRTRKAWRQEPYTRGWSSGNERNKQKT